MNIDAMDANQAADMSFVVGPDGVARTRGEHVKVFQRWLTGPGLTPVMTDEELKALKTK